MRPRIRKRREPAVTEAAIAATGTECSLELETAATGEAVLVLL